MLKVSCGARTAVAVDRDERLLSAESGRLRYHAQTPLDRRQAQNSNDPNLPIDLQSLAYQRGDATEDDDAGGAAK
jgi:hypothetical protein